MPDGWIKLHRSVMDSAVWNNPDLFKFWCWCLIKASHSAVKTSVGFKSVVLSRGQFLLSRRMAHFETGLTERTVRTCVKALVNDQRISVKTTNAFSVVTILNYDRYQSEEKTDDQQTTSETTNERPASDQRATSDPYWFAGETSGLPPTRARADAKKEKKFINTHTPARAREDSLSGADSLSDFESVFSASYRTVLSVYREETGRKGTDGNTKTGARTLAQALDAGEMTEEQLREVIRNGIRDDKLPNQGLRGIANNWERYASRQARPEAKDWWQCQECGAAHSERSTPSPANEHPVRCACGGVRLLMRR